LCRDLLEYFAYGRYVRRRIVTAETEPAVTKILIVEDHEVTRLGIRTFLDSQPGLQVTGEAATIAAAIELTDRKQFDVVLLDLDLGDEDGLDLVPILRRAGQNRILVLTGVRDRQRHMQAIRIGASGLVRKEHSLELLVQAIRNVVAGHAWLDPALAASVLNEVSRGYAVEEEDPEAAKVSQLTDREREVIALICEGLTNKVIADRLSISTTTVRHHLTSIFSKLEVENRLALLLYAIRNDLTKVR
jgi:DNA-binding NarL/FixJ family response regulator